MRSGHGIVGIEKNGGRHTLVSSGQDSGAAIGVQYQEKALMLSFGVLSCDKPTPTVHVMIPALDHVRVHRDLTA